jgi:outer membrane immunogenic protein
MNKLMQGSVMLLGLAIASPAFAADMPLKAPAPVPYVSGWDGWYVGFEIGEKWKTDDWNTGCIDTSGPLGATCGTPGNRVQFPGAPDGSSPHKFSTSGLRTGGYIGALSQYQNWVFGFEGDWAYYKRSEDVPYIVGCATDACTGGASGASPGPFSGDRTSVTNKWDGSIRLRGGFLVTPDVLLYGTGGIAFQEIEATVTCNGTTGAMCTLSNQTQTQSTVLTGYTIGGGLEWKLWRNILLRAEYRYSDFGSWKPTYFLGSGDAQVHSDIKVKSQLATFGIAYKFDGGWGGGGGPIVAKY